MFSTRMAVGLYLEELSKKYEIWGLVDEDLVPFTKNLRINAFLVRRKKLKFIL